TVGMTVQGQTKPSGPMCSTTGPGSTGPPSNMDRTSWCRCEVTEICTWTPILGLRGMNHICSSPRQPTLTTGMLLTASTGVAVGVPNCASPTPAAAAVAVSASAVTVSSAACPWNAVCVPEIAVAVMATEVAVCATLPGKVAVAVGSPGTCPAAISVSARHA